MRNFVLFFVGLGRFFVRVLKETIKDMVEEGRRKVE